MVANNERDMFPLLRDFLNYTVTVGGRSQKTADEYYLDLRTFFRYMQCYTRGDNDPAELSDVPISDIDIAYIERIKLTDVYEFLNYLGRSRATHQNSRATGHGLMASSRARKVSAIRSFYKYLEKKAHLIEENPMQDLEFPKLKQSVTRYLTLDDSLELLTNIKGRNEVRDYCIITLFLNCGMRVAELCGINLADFHGEILRIIGKGNKERIVYLNDACIYALNSYLPIRMDIRDVNPRDRNALFISGKKNRISTETVKWLVKKYCALSGLDPKISAHKLRHTSATLMYKNGVDLRALQEILGHKHLNTTE
ncbi:MAG: tyrosine-type recombinase/integrase, partial [Clostridia bacterium]